MIWFKRNIPLENKLQKLEGALGGQGTGRERGDTDGTDRAGRGHRGHMAHDLTDPKMGKISKI